MGCEAVKRLWLHLLIAISFATIVLCDPNCVYTVYIKTGSVQRAGTHSTISLTLYNVSGSGFHVANLETWGGAMGPNYNYFETGNLDIFSGTGPCLTSPVCKLELSSDGSGPYAGWYCNHVEVTTSGSHIPCAQKLFNVNQWLATDEPPYALTATIDDCYVDNGKYNLHVINGPNKDSLMSIAQEV